SQRKSFLLKEIYPDEKLIAEQPFPHVLWGDTVDFNLEPYSVRIIEVKSDSSISYPVIYGAAPSQIKKSSDGYTLTMRIPQGVTQSIGVVLPESEQVRNVS